MHDASQPPWRGRGANLNPAPRYGRTSQERCADGWDLDEDELRAPGTTVLAERARSVISYNDSPDIGFDRSLNPYRGCEHGCIYCYARPAHAYMDLSPGLDFETRLFYKQDAAKLLEQALRKPGYAPAMISLGANTDPYQPIEREYRVTRSVLEVLSAYRHPVGIVTKGAALIGRDLDLLAEMAAAKLAMVAISLTTLRDELKRTLEPRAASPGARLRAIRKLSEAGVPVIVMASPIIPFINDAELEAILEAGREAGAVAASYILVRLPNEVAPLFRQWLADHAPLKAEHVMSLINQARGGRDNDPQFFTRHRGVGPYAQLIAQRYQVACKRLGFEITNSMRMQLDTTQFRVPLRPLYDDGPQASLF
ncbi:PA0069 family radical SAM protein [Panacagrimonas sp.]|uniref:PA0069 family radical SAM protein n=1 Tax=Panacagrimonas sp. TaxID=2480088 RepID=UPI003B515C3F